MLITPLPVDEINGILLMAQFASSPTVCERASSHESNTENLINDVISC